MFSLLVIPFYEGIRKDALLGPIFNRHITKDNGSAHLEKLTDFGNCAFFGVIVLKQIRQLAHRNSRQEFESIPLPNINFQQGWPYGSIPKDFFILKGCLPNRSKKNPQKYGP